MQGGISHLLFLVKGSHPYPNQTSEPDDSLCLQRSCGGTHPLPQQTTNNVSRPAIDPRKRPSDAGPTKVDLVMCLGGYLAQHSRNEEVPAALRRPVAQSRPPNLARQQFPPLQLHGGPSVHHVPASAPRHWLLSSRACLISPLPCASAESLTFPPGFPVQRRTRQSAPPLHTIAVLRAGC